jgi:hypothetical protein
MLVRARERERERVRECQVVDDSFGITMLLQSAISYEKRVTDETHAIPWSYCGLAEIAVLERQLDVAEQHIRKARTYKSYDFESFLGWRLRKAEDDIKKYRLRQAREAEQVPPTQASS